MSALRCFITPKATHGPLPTQRGREIGFSRQWRPRQKQRATVLSAGGAPDATGLNPSRRRLRPGPRPARRQIFSPTDPARSAATAAPSRAPFRHAAAAGRGTSTHRLSRRLEVLRSCTRVGSARCVRIIACIRTRCATYLPLTARYATRSATGPHTRGCATLSRPTALPHAVRPPHRRLLEPRRAGGPARPDLGYRSPPRASSAPLPRAPGCWHGEAGEAGALRPVERRTGSAPASHAPLHCAACAELRQDAVSGLDG